MPAVRGADGVRTGCGAYARAPRAARAARAARMVRACSAGAVLVAVLAPRVHVQRRLAVHAKGTQAPYSTTSTPFSTTLPPYSTT